MSSNLPTSTSERRSGTGQEEVSDVLLLRRHNGHGHQAHDLPSAVPHIAPLTSHLFPDLVVGVLYRLVALSHAPQPAERNQQQEHRDNDDLIPHTRLD
ncbi:MAG: hypothetical protein ACRD4F_06015 [Candidatus Angelobacter sp.]